MTRYLPISLLLLFSVSCSLKTTEALRSVSVSKAEVTNTYFSNTEVDYVYKARIDVYGRYFGGVLIIKKVADNSHRVVLTSEFGSKIFDFLYEDDTFTRNFILEELDKKIIVTILRQDFKILITEKAQILEQYVSEGNEVYKTQSNNRFNFYFVDEKNKRIERIVNTSKNKEKVEFIFTSEEEDIAQNIAITHKNVKLKIDLENFKND